MQILQTVALVMGIITNAVLIVMAVFALFRLRHQSQNLKATWSVLFKVFAMVSEIKIERSFEQIEKMKATMSVLVKNEKYIEAAKVKKDIVRQEKMAMEAVKAFNETFGDIAEVGVTKITINNSD